MKEKMAVAIAVGIVLLFPLSYVVVPGLVLPQVKAMPQLYQWALNILVVAFGSLVVAYAWKMLTRIHQAIVVIVLLLFGLFFALPALIALAIVGLLFTAIESRLHK